MFLPLRVVGSQQIYFRDPCQQESNLKNWESRRKKKDLKLYFDIRNFLFVSFAHIFDSISLRLVSESPGGTELLGVQLGSMLFKQASKVMHTFSRNVL